MNRLCIQDNVKVMGKENFFHGDHVHIGANTEIQAEGGVTIGNNVLISFNCVLWTINHNYNGTILPYDFSRIKCPIVINDNVWIGRNVIINGGVHIGEGAVVGMGSVVTRNIPPLAIVGGNPARILNFRSLKRYQASQKAGEVMANKGNTCMACGPDTHGKFYYSEMLPRKKKPPWKRLLNPFILKIKLFKINQANLKL